MNLLEYFSNLKSVKEIRESQKISLGQSTDEFNMMLIASDFYNGDKSLFVVLPNLYAWRPDNPGAAEKILLPWIIRVSIPLFTAST